MRWELTEEQESLRESFRGWLDSVADLPTVRRWYDAREPEPFTARLARDGWLDIGLAEDDGGQGGGLLELCLLAEELSARAAPSGAWLGLVLARAALQGVPAAADLVGPAEGRKGQTVLALSASDLPAAAVPARVGADGRLSGAISTVLGAEGAATFIVPAAAAGRVGLYAVDAASDGVRIETRHLVDRSRAGADILLDGAPAADLRVDAEEALARVTDTVGPLLAADSVGAMQTMLDMTVAYTLQRKQFGVPIGSFQAVKHGAATMLVSVEAARSIGYFAAASVEAGEPESSLHAAVAKAQATAEGAVTADTALTLHGAIGYTWEHDLHLFYKRAKLNERLYGAPETWNDTLAEALGVVASGR